METFRLRRTPPPFVTISLASSLHVNRYMDIHIYIYMLRSVLVTRTCILRLVTRDTLTRACTCHVTVGNICINDVTLAIYIYVYIDGDIRDETEFPIRGRSDRSHILTRTPKRTTTTRNARPWVPVHSIKSVIPIILQTITVGSFISQSDEGHSLLSNPRALASFF